MCLVTLPPPNWTRELPMRSAHTHSRPHCVLPPCETTLYATTMLFSTAFSTAGPMTEMLTRSLIRT